MMTDGAFADDNNSAEAYCSRGNAYEEKGDIDKAIADYSKAICLDPNYALAYYRRGNAYEEKREYDNAIADWKKVLQINLFDTTARTNLERLRSMVY